MLGSLVEDPVVRWNCAILVDSSPGEVHPEDLPVPDVIYPLDVGVAREHPMSMDWVTQGALQKSKQMSCSPLTE